MCVQMFFFNSTIYYAVYEHSPRACKCWCCYKEKQSCYILARMGHLFFYYHILKTELTIERGPLGSPLMLDFSGKFKGVHLPLRFPGWLGPSFVPAPWVASCKALVSCSSSIFVISPRKKPLPPSPPQRSIFREARPEHRSCRTELYENHSATYLEKDNNSRTIHALSTYL